MSSCFRPMVSGAGFVKVTGDPLVSETNYWGNVAWADYDNDGDLDVFLTTGGRFFTTGPVALHRNDGAGHFTKMTTNDVGQLVSERVNSASCAWGDYDGRWLATCGDELVLWEPSSSGAWSP